MGFAAFSRREGVEDFVFLHLAVRLTARCSTLADKTTWKSRSKNSALQQLNPKPETPKRLTLREVDTGEKTELREEGQHEGNAKVRHPGKLVGRIAVQAGNVGLMGVESQLPFVLR